jgi:hypothetical protein
MGQLITTIMNIIVLLLVPLGVLQVHTVLQMKNELLEMSLAATKYVTNHGGMNDSDVVAQIRGFIRQEVSQKSYRLDENEIQIEVTRTKAADPMKWSHEDDFLLRMSIPYPQLTTLFPEWQRPLVVERTGTVNVMDYDL